MACSRSAHRGSCIAGWVLVMLCAQPSCDAFAPPALLLSHRTRFNSPSSGCNYGPPARTPLPRSRLLRMASASSVPEDTKVAAKSTFDNNAGFTASAEVKEVDSMAVLRLMMPRDRNLQFRGVMSSNPQTSNPPSPSHPSAQAGHTLARERYISGGGNENRSPH
jgi:hypothetical protein